MPIPLKPLDPRIQMSPRLWVGLLWTGFYGACLILGLAIAALMAPIGNGLEIFVQAGFGLVLALDLVVIALTARHLTRVLIVEPAAWRWVVLLLATAAVIAVAIWSSAVQSVDTSALPRLGILFLSALGMAAAAAVGLRALVMILASHVPGVPGYPPTPGHQTWQPPAPPRPR